ncbi:SAM-dependent methyltransferase [Phaeospirillum tilakii]|uniref:SAM-dependent methyltransferase n=1 Tax=Phaeospirillum tilakii TaxID=741673 RepID=A0ABW5CBY1_9PROT
MQSDFLDAHHRHWGDAELLFQQNRLANADHLYGVAAECGLKRLMLAFGMVYDSAKDRPADSRDAEHVKKIWSRFENYRSGHPAGPNYILPPENPFADWHVGQRYAPRSNFDNRRVGDHKAGASQVRALVHQALRDGLI